MRTGYVDMPSIHAVSNCHWLDRAQIVEGALGDSKLIFDIGGSSARHRVAIPTKILCVGLGPLLLGMLGVLMSFLRGILQ